MIVPVVFLILPLGIGSATALPDPAPTRTCAAVRVVEASLRLETVSPDETASDRTLPWVIWRALDLASTLDVLIRTGRHLAREPLAATTEGRI